MASTMERFTRSAADVAMAWRRSLAIPGNRQELWGLIRTGAPPLSADPAETVGDGAGRKRSDILSFDDVPGVAKRIKDALYKAGYGSVGSVRRARVVDLMEGAGLDRTEIEKIRKAL